MTFTKRPFFLFSLIVLSVAFFFFPVFKDSYNGSELEMFCRELWLVSILATPIMCVVYWTALGSEYSGGKSWMTADIVCAVITAVIFASYIAVWAMMFTSDFDLDLLKFNVHRFWQEWKIATQMA